MAMKCDLELVLNDENLLLYQNIQSLKELTAQATSLLNRSNAVYQNILTDVEMATTARGLSDSTGYNSFTPDAKCETCGLYHGVKFCIVDQIDKEEKFWAEKRNLNLSVSIGSQWKDKKKDIPSKYSDSTESKRKTIEEEHKTVPERFGAPWSLAMDNRSPDEILTGYEALCSRFGSSSGRRYLLATSLTEEKQPWVCPPLKKIHEETSAMSNTTFRKREIQCVQEQPPVSDRLCLQYSEGVRKKLDKLVEFRPSCQIGLEEKPKSWRDILCKSRRASDHKEIIVHPVEIIEKRKINEFVVCKCGAMDCGCGGIERCAIPPARKTCQLRDGECNYLCTIRSRVARRRQARERRRISSALPSDHQTILSKPRKSQQFTLLAHAEALTMLDDCVGNELTTAGLESLATYQKNIEVLARLVSPTSMIPDREWNVWYDNYLQGRGNGSDEDSCSFDSDIQSSVSRLSEHSLSDLDFKERPMPPSRIPYAEESYNLINRLFARISFRLEKYIKKKSGKPEFYASRTNCASRLRKLSLLKSESEMLREIFVDMEGKPFFPTMFTPIAVRRRTKINHMNVIASKYRNASKRRTVLQRIQQGKHLKCRKNTSKYTKEGDYRGFTPRKRRLLRMIESKRFASSNWVRDDAGQKITKKTFHDDYRLLCNLFDEPSSHWRISLLDEGMKQRMDMYKNINHKYGEPALPEPPECASAPDVEISGDLIRRRKKLEKQDIRFVRSVPKHIPGGLKSEEPKYGAVRSGSPRSSASLSKNDGSYGKEFYNPLDQTVRVSTRRMGTKQVSQNVLLGADSYGKIIPRTKDDNGSNLKMGSLRNSVVASLELETQAKNMEAASSSAANTSNPLPLPPSVKEGSLSPSNILPSSSRRASRATPIEPQLDVPARLNVADKSSTGESLSLKNITPKVSSKVVSKTLSSGSNEMTDSQMMFPTASSIFGESVDLGKDRRRSRSVIAEAGSKVIPLGIKSDVVSGAFSQMREIYEPASSQREEPKELKKQKPKARDKDFDLLSDLSLTKLRGMKPADRLGPTKKRVFGVDIGQGINHIQYLKDSAAGADEDMKHELLNLLIDPREKKRAIPGKPVTSKTTILAESQQASLPRESEKSSQSVIRRTKMSLDDEVGDSLVRLKKNHIKTLDQIYKEVHGINRKNTPAPLVENDYEHEMMKKQQLRKHRIM